MVQGLVLQKIAPNKSHFIVTHKSDIPMRKAEKGRATILVFVGK